MFGTRKKDIDVVGRSKKTTAVLVVASHQSNDHDFGFFPLKIIDGGDPQSLREGGLDDIWLFKIVFISSKACIF